MFLYAEHNQEELKKYGQDATNVGDEGGFAPNIQVMSLCFLSSCYREGQPLLCIFLSYLAYLR